MPLEKELREELERQVEAWAQSYRNVSSLGKQLAELDAMRASIEEKMMFEESERDRTAGTINSLIEDIDEPELVAEVESVIAEYGGLAMVEGMV